MTCNRLTYRNGFATVLAVALIALVAIALASMAAVMHVEARQAIIANMDVQAREMLVAAQPYAREALTNAGSNEGTVALPDGLKQNNGRLSFNIQRNGDAAADVTIRAVYGTVLRSQMLRFVKENDVWELEEATLLPLQHTSDLRRNAQEP